MGLAVDVLRIEPRVTPRGEDRTLSARSEGAFVPHRTSFRRRVVAFCEMNRPALVAVVGLSRDGSSLEAAWHPDLSDASVDGAFCLAVTGEAGPGGSRASLSRQTLDRLLDAVPEDEEQGFLAVDARGLHRFGRAELFAEGLYLLRKKRGETI